MSGVFLIVVIIVVAALIILGTTLLFARFYRKVEQGKALIVNKMRAEPEVTFTGMVVLPIFHKAEIMDISVKTLEIDRRGKGGTIRIHFHSEEELIRIYERITQTTGPTGPTGDGK